MNLGDKIQFITVYKYLPCLMTIEIFLVFILKFMASCFLFIFHLEFIWMCGIFFGGGDTYRKCTGNTKVFKCKRVKKKPYSPHLSSEIRSDQSLQHFVTPMKRSTPGLPVHHQLPEFTQTHVHRVSDAIQPSHPLSSSSPPAPNPSQHQSLFQ